METEDRRAIETMATLMSWLATGMHGAPWVALLSEHGFTEKTWQTHYTAFVGRFQTELPLAEAYAALYQEACRARFAEAANPNADLARDWAGVFQVAEKHAARIEATRPPERGYRPNLALIADAVAMRAGAIERLFDDRSTVFVVDHREEPLDIVDLVSARLPDAATIGIAGLTEDSVELAAGERTVSVELAGAPRDRYAVLVACNQVLGPDHEIRFCVDSHGSDTLVFIVLSAADWRVALSSDRFAALTERDLFES